MESDDSQPQKARKHRRVRMVLGSLCTLAIVAGALGGAAYYYNKYQQVRRDPNVLAKEEVQYLTQQVGRHIALPKNETPTIATVSDKKQLQQQAFFASAKNGDKVLLYTKAKKAILYRPSEDKIIEVAPMVVDKTKVPEAKTAEP